MDPLHVPTVGYLPGDQSVLIVMGVLFSQLKHVQANIVDLVVVDDSRDDFKHHVKDRLRHLQQHFLPVIWDLLKLRKQSPS